MAQQWNRRPADGSRNTRALLLLDNSPQRYNKRLRLSLFAVVIVVLALILRLTWVQLIAGPTLAEHAAAQRTAVIAEPAHRGAIVDREGRNLAYTMEAKSLSVLPNKLRGYMDERHKANPEEVPPADERIEQIIEELPDMIPASEGRVKKEDLRKKLTDEKVTYTVLVRNVAPDVAQKVTEKFPEITAERQDIRQYPNGAVAQNIIGKISSDNQGQFGLELSQDSRLQGINGSKTLDIAGGLTIPGSARDEHPPVNGDNFELTLDLDAQAFIQQQVQQAKDNSKAESASAVVLDAKSAEVIAMASSDTIDPNGDLQKQLRGNKAFGDRNTAETFEPGSIAKIMTAAAAIEEKKTTPDEVLKVPGSIDMAGVTVRDAWEHGVAPYTTTGVFGKSSNVGTLMLAERVGQEKMYEYFRKFGVGQAADVGMPHEAAGYMPEFSQWSGGTFANLPIGQGLSMNLLQMASIYQTIANDGVRVQPRLIKSITNSDGEDVPQPVQSETRAVSAETAKTVRAMFQSVTQSDPNGVQNGTGAAAAVEGYQIAGKTGTAQQIDPDTGAYSNSNYWITFAGIAPADNPRFVVAIMLDNPQRGTEEGGGGGGSAAPTFHNIASWLMDHYNVPPSPKAPRLMLEAR
ncbi:penicillin-binding protein 2 [Corynebacterium sp.]|uniref:peptidoglycan D,D-transpeptidase FtsI family protein n=1 Tax=Corynebacterium sp. TaxID=1720 RepID=UPI00262226F5|nr:penicillin-binding protein 2 [Corynebacterium sp.]